MMRNRLMVAGMTLLTVAGCSSRPETPKTQAGNETARPEASTPTKVATDVAVVAPPEATKANPSIEQAAPTVEPTPRSPYEGLEAKQVALYTKVQGLLEPVAKGGTVLYDGLKADVHRAKAIMKFGQFNISLDLKAEKKLRATVTAAMSTSSFMDAYRTSLRNMWFPPAPNLPKTPFIPYRSRKFLVEAYEKALDEDVEFSPTIRRLLGSMARSEGVDSPSFEIGLEPLAGELRTKLIEQKVTGDLVYELAYAMRERGEYIHTCRAWTKVFFDLVNALPPSYRSDLVIKLAWDEEKEAEDEEKRKQAESMRAEAERYNPNKPEFRRPFPEPVVKSMDEKRRDKTANFFHDTDAQGWSLLCKYDGILAELQTVLDAVVPDLQYRFRPLIPSDAPKGVEENALLRFKLSGSARDRTFTIEGL